MLELAAVPVGAVADPAIVGADSAPTSLFLSCPTPQHAAAGRAMKRHSFLCGLSTATLATGLLLVGSTSASAQNTEHAPAQLVAGSTDTATVLPPVLGKARFTCHDEGANVTARLRNPNATVQHYMVGITAGDIHYDYVVSPAARGAELVEFGGLPNGTYLLQVQNAAGVFDAQTRVRVQCDVTPPTGTPTGTPTGPPSKTPTAVPTTGMSSRQPPRRQRQWPCQPRWMLVFLALSRRMTPTTTGRSSASACWWPSASSSAWSRSWYGVAADCTISDRNIPRG